MHALLFLTALLATALGAPATSPAAPFNDRHQLKCPPNPLQPDGKYPQDTGLKTLVLPVSRRQPNKAFPMTGWGKVTPNDFCTLHSTKLPYKPGYICNRVAYIPSRAQAGSLLEFEGEGNFYFQRAVSTEEIIPGKTNWNNKPAPAEPGKIVVLKPGHSYILKSEPSVAEVVAQGMMCSMDTKFIWKATNEPWKCPIGFYHFFTKA